MNKLSDKFEILLNEKMESLKQHIEDLSWLPELPEDWVAEAIFPLGNLSYRVGIPFNRSLYDPLIKLMTEQGWEYLDYASKIDESKLDGWYPYMYFKKDDHRVEFVFFDFYEGAICKKVKMGKVTEDVDVYEFVCK